MLTVDYETGWGERARLAICSDRYAGGGALALLALDATDPGDEEEYLDLWCSLTVNLPGDPVASAWCADAGHVVLDANDVPRALVDALERAGVVEPSGRSARSGFCSYPLATVPRAPSRASVATRRPCASSPRSRSSSSGRTAMAEAPRSGAAPRGARCSTRSWRPPPPRPTRSPRGGCEWAAVRVGSGGVEDVDCETGETVHVAGER